MIKIGLETHIQLKTNSKLFCGCKNTVSEQPNTLTCEICLGFPGSKPVLNKAAITQALKVALALDCEIAPETFFSRKSYFYPDLPKNFQITQYEIPIAKQGKLDNIRIRRIHLEEDPGRLVHEGPFTFIDYNRSGIPLIEVVTEPDFKSPEETKVFLQKLTTILEYLGVYTRVSEATLRTDANISIEGGQRVEVKNITGVKDIEKALQYEIVRQQNAVKSGQKVSQETRAWDPLTRTTRSLRLKETEEDYGYIFEPDLTKIEINKQQVKEIKDTLPELAHERTQRFVKQLKINETDAKILTADLLLAELFEKVAEEISPTLAAKWLRRELLRVLNYNKKTIQDLEIDETHLIDLLTLIEKKQITDTTAQKILERLIEKPFDVKEFIKREKAHRVTDTSTLKSICKEAIKENPQAVKDYQAGREEALHFITGSVMKKTRGAADPALVKKILLEEIKV